MKGARKFWLYVITFVGVMIVDWYAIYKGMTIPFDGMTVSGIFAFVVAGTTAEHFSKKAE